MNDLPAAEIPEGLQRYMDGLAAHDIDLIASTFSDDIAFITPQKTMRRDEILAFLAALYRAFPDWSYEHDPPFDAGDGSIGVVWRQGGTHTATLAFPGFEPVSATGKSVRIPEHPFYYRVVGSLVAEIRPDPVPGGAPRGIFEQIGVKLPPL